MNDAADTKPAPALHDLQQQEVPQIIFRRQNNLKAILKAADKHAEYIYEHAEA